MTDTYDATWGSPVGKDCVDLCSTLPRWLGERLTFLGMHTNLAPISYFASNEDLDAPIHVLERWRSDLTKCGAALSLVGNLSNLDLTIDEEEKAHADAEEAMLWVAINLGNLWD